VLLVEDTVSQQKLMGKWLNGQGCEVTFAINGKIGLELLKTRQFDICLMDFLMVGFFPLLSSSLLSSLSALKKSDSLYTLTALVMLSSTLYSPTSKLLTFDY
jgi:CheY-like chemotaxis protein